MRRRELTNKRPFLTNAQAQEKLNTMILFAPDSEFSGKQVLARNIAFKLADDDKEKCYYYRELNKMDVKLLRKIEGKID
jgi:hypothetical protein